MSFGVPGSLDYDPGPRDTKMDPQLHRRLAMHGIEYAEARDLDLDERRELLDILGYPESAA